MTRPSPHFISHKAHPILDQRKRKRLKLEILRERSLAKRKNKPKPADEESEGVMILSQLDNSNLSEISSDKEEDEGQLVSPSPLRATTAIPRICSAQPKSDPGVSTGALAGWRTSGWDLKACFQRSYCWTLTR